MSRERRGGDLKREDDVGPEHLLGWIQVCPARVQSIFDAFHKLKPIPMDKGQHHCLLSTDRVKTIAQLQIGNNLIVSFDFN